MSKKVKYFKWIGENTFPEYNALVRETKTHHENVTYGGKEITFEITHTLSCEEFLAYWQEIKWPEFRKLKSELLKGKKGN